MVSKNMGGVSKYQSKQPATETEEKEEKRAEEKTDD